MADGRWRSGYTAGFLDSDDRAVKIALRIIARSCFASLNSHSTSFAVMISFFVPSLNQ
jgi:hypothetical protein